MHPSFQRGRCFFLIFLCCLIFLFIDSDGVWTTITHTETYQQHVSIEWWTTEFLASSCLFGNYTKTPETVRTGWILNSPFGFAEQNLNSSIIQQFYESDGDVVLGDDGHGQNYDYVHLRFPPYTTSNDVLTVQRLVFAADPSDTTIKWKQECPMPSCWTAQDHPLIQFPIKTTTLTIFAYTYPIEGDNVVTEIQVLDNRNGRLHIPKILFTSVDPTQTHHLWLQNIASNSNTVYFLMRSVYEYDAILVAARFDEDGHLDRLRYVDRVVFSTTMVCGSDEWVLSGFNVLYVWHFNSTSGEYDWFQTLMPPFHHYNIHPSACDIMNDTVVVAWYLDQQNESQTFLEFYKLPFSPLPLHGGGSTPQPFWNATSDFHFVALADQITTIHLFKSNETHMDLWTTGYGEITDDPNPAAQIRLYQINAHSNATYYELQTNGSIVSSALSSDGQYLVICGDQCHAEEECAGGQMSLLRLYNN